MHPLLHLCLTYCRRALPLCGNWSRLLGSYFYLMCTVPLTLVHGAPLPCYSSVFGGLRWSMMYVTCVVLVRFARRLRTVPRPSLVICNLLRYLLHVLRPGPWTSLLTCPFLMDVTAYSHVLRSSVTMLYSFLASWEMGS